MKRPQANVSKRGAAARASALRSFLDLSTMRTSRRFGTAISGSLLVHALMLGLWLSTAIIHKPEVLEIREISFFDENQIPEKVAEPEVPIGSGSSWTLTQPGGSGGSEAAPLNLKNDSPPGNTALESQPGSINAERGQEEVNVNKIGVLGLLEGVGETGGSGSDLSLNMQAAAGVVEGLKMNRSLTVGRGQNPKGQPKDGALFATSRSGQGIIDALVDVDIDAGEGVALKKGGRVQFAGFGGTAGSGGAYGARSEASLYAVLQKHLGRLQYIYEKYLRNNPSLGGKVEVEVTINSDGKVAKVAFLSSEIRVAGFLDELAAFISRWKYDPIDHGVVRVVYPLLFVKVG